ncbi:MAG: type II toxin-antitoxin system HicA family toxin [Gammaproteobacteria bacterium]|nr:type II toxin-antitoxin system HicA family toxin [Gammaproteobacteria bacterium]MDE0511675.1 type II toxin-antitoxin system HicA family toxin [Gammaproteobacteria bacterium]
MAPTSFTPEVKRILKNHGCRFYRKGKGDHEIWHSPLTHRKITVDGKILSRHTANETLKQAGIAKSF